MSKRKTGLDLLKMISMLMVILLHQLNKGGLLEKATPNSVNSYLYLSFDSMLFIAVNCFAIITGYLMIRSKWKIESYLKLWFTVFFYAVMISIITYFILKNHLDMTLFYNSFLPVSKVTYWYFTAYTGLFFLIPLINIGIVNLSKKQIQYGLGVIFIIGTISSLSKSNAFTLQDGYSMVWLIFMYYIGAYIRLHLDVEKLNSKKIFLSYLLISLLTSIIIILSCIISTKLSGAPQNLNWLINYTSPLTLISSLLFFLFFLSLTIKNQTINQLLFKLSPLSFSVYLIHTHPIIFNYFFANLYGRFANKNPFKVFALMMASALLIYTLCSLIDYFRVKLFKLSGVDTLANKLAKLFNKYVTVN